MASSGRIWWHVVGGGGDDDDDHHHDGTDHGGTRFSNSIYINSRSSASAAVTGI